MGNGKAKWGKLQQHLFERDPSDIELIAGEVDEKADLLLQCLQILPYLCVIFLIEFFHCFKLYNNLSFNQQISLMRTDILSAIVYPDFFF
jgi:hypothetical protein